MTEPSKDPRIGTLIREYEILEVLGQGGMGSVYRARHTLLDEIRAIKLIKASLQEDTNFVNRFIREAKILVKLRHPNLVYFYEFGALEENVFFMVIEFLHGESALERVSRLQKIPFQDALRIVREAALGLHRAHQKDVIHRDISPDNLLIVKKEDGTEITKVIDFGIAKPVGAETYTHNNAFLGKPEFCSPEQCGILKEGEVIDARCDIYSLGVTLYFLLTGKLPFHSTSSAGYLVKHVQAVPKPISEYLPSAECPPQLEALIAKTLAKNRDERFSTMEEFARALEELETSKVALPAPEIPVDLSRMQPGYRFMNRYDIEGTVYEGRKGIVYKAKDLQLQTIVALKIINPVLMPAAKDRSRFVRGLRLAQRVTHSNVCRVYEIAETGKNIYVSMEFLEGSTLAEILQYEGRLRLPQALRLFKQLLAGLSEAHRVGVIHRNLKPQNIMIGPTNEARLMDFASSISPDADGDNALISSAGEFVGTPSYMAPEQFEAVQPDHTVDVYSFGVLMFQVLTGRLPFAGKTLPALVYAHSKTEPEKPSTIIPDFPVELERIILKAMQKKPGDRYQSARELLAELQAMEDSARKFRDLFVRGKQLYDENKLKEAVLVWREALAMFPQDAAVQRFIAAAENRMAGMR